MMTKLLSNTYAGIIEVFMWLFILGGLGAGIGSGVTDNKVLDGLIGLVVAAALAAFFFGPFLLLIEIRKMLGNIEQRVVYGTVPKAPGENTAGW